MPWSMPIIMARLSEATACRSFPFIESERLSREKQERYALYLFQLLITGSVHCFHAFHMIKKKNNNLKKRGNDEAHQRETGGSNKIKEEYVRILISNSYMPNTLRVLKIQKNDGDETHTKKIDELRFTVDSISIKREREELYHSFDEFFLTLFPDFVTVFQSLFKEEDPDSSQRRTTAQHRVADFALMRLGISDADRIATILDYSVGTIYTYKARIRNKAIVPGDDFDKQIMAIRTL